MDARRDQRCRLRLEGGPAGAECPSRDLQRRADGDGDQSAARRRHALHRLRRRAGGQRSAGDRGRHHCRGRDRNAQGRGLEDRLCHEQHHRGGLHLDAGHPRIFTGRGHLHHGTDHRDLDDYGTDHDSVYARRRHADGELDALHRAGRRQHQHHAQSGRVPYELDVKRRRVRHVHDELRRDADAGHLPRGGHLHAGGGRHAHRDRRRDDPFHAGRHRSDHDVDALHRPIFRGHQFHAEGEGLASRLYGERGCKRGVRDSTRRPHVVALERHVPRRPVDHRRDREPGPDGDLHTQRRRSPPVRPHDAGGRHARRGELHAQGQSVENRRHAERGVDGDLHGHRGVRRAHRDGRDLHRLRPARRRHGVGLGPERLWLRGGRHDRGPCQSGADGGLDRRPVSVGWLLPQQRLDGERHGDHLGAELLR